jgi:methylated-DNA-[protein]-cysteine S-methyltransferase
VGNAVHKNQQLITIPCHRVVRSDHRVGNYSQGIAKKINLLQNEGIKIKGEKIANFASYIYEFN